MSAPTPTASAAPTVSPATSPSTKPLSSGMKPSASTEKPNIFGSCPTMIVNASPFMYPICVGIDRRSAMNPSFASPARSMMVPTMRASSDASAIALAGSLSAPISGRIVAAIIGPRAESGPRTRTFEGPMSQYPNRASIDV